MYRKHFKGESLVLAPRILFCAQIFLKAALGGGLAGRRIAAVQKGRQRGLDELAPAVRLAAHKDRVKQHAVFARRVPVSGGVAYLN